MNTITSTLSTATTLFGGVVTLAVLVTGFFLGLRWMKSAMKEEGSKWDDSWGERPW